MAAYTKARHETLVARQLTSELVSHLLPTYFRINIILIRIPPLRERPEDIPKLADEILLRIAAERRWGDISLDGSAMKLLVAYPFAGQHPGNAQRSRTRSGDCTAQSAYGA